MIAAVFALLFGGAAFAQSGSAGATSAGSSQKNPSATSSSTAPSSYDSSGTTSHSTAPNEGQPTTATGSGYHSGTAGADIDSTKEINAQHSSSSIGAGAMTGRDTTSSKDKLSWGDRHFVTKAADGGKDEVAIAQLAATQASNSEVKAFAQKLVDDHTKVNEELTGIAQQKNVKLENDDDHDRSYKRLAKKSGMEFDRDFVEHMIDDHEKDIKMFEKAAKDAKDSEVRAFASKHVDHLREHLKIAQGLRATVMPTGRMDDSSGRSTPGGTPSASTSTSDASATPSASSTSGSNTSGAYEGPSSSPAPKNHGNR
jgi:putative membrane protein